MHAYCTTPPAPAPPRKRSPSATVDTGLETRWGGGPENPTTEEMRAAPAELDTPDMEHPSTWLSDDEGWTVDVYESGLIIFSQIVAPARLFQRSQFSAAH